MGIAFRAVIGAALICGVRPVSAAEMPARIYTTQDGLVRDYVCRIRRDSHGYLWFGTAEGLSIFDGYQFTNYTVADGLPNRQVDDILETRSGEYWLATAGGLCRFDPRASHSRFTAYRVGEGVLANDVNVLLERRDRSIWFGTEGGLWRLRRSGTSVSPERIGLPSPQADNQRILGLLEDREGNLWAAASDGLYAVWNDGRVARFANGQAEDEFTRDVLQDRQGRIWTATDRGVCRIARHPVDTRNFVERLYKLTPRPTALFESRDGKLWVAGWGLFQFDPDAPQGRSAFRFAAPGFGAFPLGPVAEDSDGNLWAGGYGALKVSRRGFTRYSTADGLSSLVISAITEDRSGRVCPMMSTTNYWTTLFEYDGNRFSGGPPYRPAGFEFGWGESQISFQDHLGDWWVPSLNGVLRFAAPAHVADLMHARPKTIYTTRDGLPDNRVLRLFEDSRGDVWIGLAGGLARWRRSSGQIESYSVTDGLRAVTEQPPVLGTPQSLAEDRLGRVWVGFYPFGLARYRDGRFDFYTEADGLPKGQIKALYTDHAGRLWVGSSQGGLARIDDVAAPRPAFRIYSVTQGLSSNQILTVVEDRAGLIYVGGGRGVDRLDPETGHVRHFTAADGLSPMGVQYSLRDRSGALWFASPFGLSRYTPERDRSSEPQPPLIRMLRIAGKPAPVSVLGESAIAGIRLPAARNNLRIEFASLHFASGEILRYQYRLEGADRDWSPPIGERAVNYASLSPGRYRFLVRAVNGDGRSSARSAAVDFVILPPVWRQAWFIGLILCCAAATLYAAYRYRVRHLLQLERIRTRLASDLHDDIGSGLAEIAILTEVAELQQVSNGGDVVRRAGDRARQLREAMSDIVWSVDPQHGSLTGLIGRVRQTVYSLMESEGRRIVFEAPDNAGDLSLTPDRARNVLLIAKEALTNVLKHSGASLVSVRLTVENRRLMLEVRDDGRGFEPARVNAGMGLRNLRRRAAECQGELIVETAPGQGVRVMLSLPLR